MKEAYEKLRKEYDLPDYDTVNNELEVSSFEDEEFLLRKIRRKSLEKLDEVSMIIGSVLQPAAESLIDMQECSFFDDNDQKKMVEIYKKIMILKRLSTEAEIYANNKKDAEFVNRFFKEWKGLKENIIPFVEKMKTCWESETEASEKLDYMG